MNKPLTQRDSLSILLFFVVGLLVFGMIIYASLSEQDDPQAKLLAQAKWVKNDLFINSLTRYNEIYHRLKHRHDKEALAVAYLSSITKDLFLFPNKSGNFNVLLPDITVKANYVLKEIKVGPDNGLYNALQYMLNRSKRSFQPPPFYSQHTNQLLRYIITGQEVQFLLNNGDIFKEIEAGG